MGEERLLRENVDLEDHEAQGFTRWTTVMRQRRRGKHRYVRRQGQEGFYRSTWANGVMADVVAQCGIYELKVVINGKHKVVYVGCTCRCREDASLKMRVNEYLQNGSHKARLINRALRRGAEICVRVKPCGQRGNLNQRRERAEGMEKDLLARYDYAWNKRENNAIRRIKVR